MSLGLVLGGAAEGFGKGLKYARELKEQQEADETRQRGRAVRRGVENMAVEGDTVDRNFDPTDSIDKAMAPPPKTPGLLSKLLHHVKPDEAAAKAGLQLPQPAAPALQGSAAGDGLQAPAPAAAAPAPADPAQANLDEVTVTPNRTRKVTAHDVALQQVMIARKSGDPKMFSEAIQNLDKVSKDETKGDLEMFGNSIGGLENIMHRLGHKMDYTEAADGKYNVTIDGQDMGSHSVDELRDQAIGYVTQTPGYAAAAARQRSADERLAMAARTDADYKTARVEIDRQEAATRNRLADAQIGKYNAETADTADEMAARKSFRDALTGDPTLNPDAAMTAARMAYKPVVNVVKDADGNSQQVVTYPGAKIMETEIAARQARQAASPYVKNKTIFQWTNPADNQRYWVVNGIPGKAFTDFTSAENAAYRYVPIKAPAKSPAPAKK